MRDPNKNSVFFLVYFFLAWLKTGEQREKKSESILDNYKSCSSLANIKRLFGPLLGTSDVRKLEFGIQIAKQIGKFRD